MTEFYETSSDDLDFDNMPPFDVLDSDDISLFDNPDIIWQEESDDTDIPTSPSADTRTDDSLIPREQRESYRILYEDAICPQTDPEIFFPEKGEWAKEAKRVCQACEVASLCLHLALENHESFGVWGGFSKPERQYLINLWDVAEKQDTDWYGFYEDIKPFLDAPTRNLSVLRLLSQLSRTFNEKQRVNLIRKLSGYEAAPAIKKSIMALLAYM
jgi:WhiB family redox-sensing transcriptional regulator